MISGVECILFTGHSYMFCKLPINVLYQLFLLVCGVFFIDDDDDFYMLRI